MKSEVVVIRHTIFQDNFQTFEGQRTLLFELEGQPNAEQPLLYCH